MRYRHAMPFGAEISAAGTRFRLWAPAAQSVTLQLELQGSKRQLDMPALDDGWFAAHVADVSAGARYAFGIDGGNEGGVSVPDPASRFNPDDVHSPSMVVDPFAYEWRNAGWTG
nr:malto-oligosyltrehalose trehalohydrolase [Pseudomonadota bacterium]